MSRKINNWPAFFLQIFFNKPHLCFTHENFMKLLMFWSMHSFPGDFVTYIHEAFLWASSLGLFYNTRLLWQVSMGWFRMAPSCRCGFVKGLSVFIVVFCVITLCVGTISHFHLPHPNLPIQLFKLVTFCITTSVGQHFPPLLIGCCKLTLKTFHLSLSGRNPDQTCKDHFGL